MTEQNQEIKADAGKPRLSLVPTEIIRDIAYVRMYGVNRYKKGGEDNWKQVEKWRFKDAAFRHLLAYMDDENSVDVESKLPHLWHCCCNLAFLCEMEKEHGKETQ